MYLPDDRLSDISRWAALRTAARWEKKVADELAQSGVPVYLPLMTRVVHYRNKRRLTRVPVFSGYLFCSEQDFLGNRRIPLVVRSRIAQVLKPADYDELKDELQSIAELLGRHELVQQRLYGEPGESVVITGGPLVGCQGLVVRYKPNKCQLVLRISFLNREIEVDIEESLVRKA